MKNTSLLTLVYLFLTACGVVFIYGAAQLNEPLFALFGAVIGLFGGLSLNAKTAR